MSSFLSELGKKLADQWLTLLVLPGLLWVGAIVAAAVLGQESALDVGVLQAWIDNSARAPTAVIIADAVAVLAVSASGGIASAWLGRAVERLWTTPGRRFPGPWLIRRRTKRWDRAYAAVRAEIDRAASQVISAGTGPPPAEVPRVRSAGLADAMDRCGRICLVPPARPVWIGDRFRSVDVRIHRTYELDLSAAWPRLWLVLPDAPREDFSAAYDAYLSAARLVGWGVLYLAVGPWWWPALVVGTGAGATGWIRARKAAEVLADLTESTVDLYGVELARQLGLECEGPLTKDVGRQLTERLRKDDTLLR